MKLAEPSEQYKDSFLQAVKEYKNENPPNNRDNHYRQLDPTELEKNFSTYVQKIRDKAKGKNLPEGYVPETTLWLVDGNEFLGRISIRHELTAHLLEVGGHVGYDVRPSQRGKGYGSKILELALPKIKLMGLKKVLITCDITNVPSKKNY